MITRVASSVLGVVLRLTVLVAVLAGCQAAQLVMRTVEPSTPEPSGIALPPDSASAREVMDAYLAALRAGDCKTAHALGTPTFRFGNGEICGWLTIRSVTLDPGVATPNDHEAVFATTMAIVDGDSSMPDGTYTWFYDLQRQPGGEWRITGGGSGP